MNEINNKVKGTLMKFENLYKYSNWYQNNIIRILNSKNSWVIHP